MIAGVGIDLPGRRLCILVAVGTDVLEAVTLAVHFDNMNVLGEPLEQRADQRSGPSTSLPRS